MDVATNSMSIPGMEDADTGAGGMFGGFFGGTKMGGGSPGQWLDTALYTRNKRAGTEGAHAIPPGMRMGNSLPLIPVAGSQPVEGREDDTEKPKMSIRDSRHTPRRIWPIVHRHGRPARILG